MRLLLHTSPTHAKPLKDAAGPKHAHVEVFLPQNTKIEILFIGTLKKKLAMTPSKLFH